MYVQVCYVSDGCRLHAFLVWLLTSQEHLVDRCMIQDDALDRSSLIWCSRTLLILLRIFHTTCLRMFIFHTCHNVQPKEILYSFIYFIYISLTALWNSRLQTYLFIQFIPGLPKAAHKFVKHSNCSNSKRTLKSHITNIKTNTHKRWNPDQVAWVISAQSPPKQLYLHLVPKGSWWGVHQPTSQGS